VIDAIGSGEVCVWRIPLTATDEDVGRFHDVLSDEERARIARRACQDGRRLMVCWGRARGILGELIECRPADVRLLRGPAGRPSLDHGPADLHLSLSHSGEWGLLAVSHGASVGVDVERIRPLQAVARLSERFLSPPEAGWVLTHADAGSGAFFRVWTRKEALLKGLGLGVPGGLQCVSVVGSGGRDLVVAPPYSGWGVVDLEAPSGYAAAVAYEKGIPVVKVSDAP